MFICCLSPNKKNKKTKIYTVLELGILEYCVNGTRVYQARVPHNFFFKHTNPTQQCHGGKTNEELGF